MSDFRNGRPHGASFHPLLAHVLRTQVAASHDHRECSVAEDLLQGRESVPTVEVMPNAWSAAQYIYPVAFFHQTVVARAHGKPLAILRYLDGWTASIAFAGTIPCWLFWYPLTAMQSRSSASASMLKPGMYC